MRKRIFKDSAAIPAVVLQAPDTGTGSLKDEKKKRAEHELLNSAGEVVENEEDANGIRYTLLGLTDRPFTYQYGANPQVDKFAALFGAKTLATNESSAIRNNPKGAGTLEEQIDAVEERFALWATGKYVDRTREGVGAKVDRDALAQAICDQFVSEGKWTQDEVDTAKKAAVRQKLEDDAAYLTNARKHPPFAARYAQIVGRATKSTDDFSV